MLVKKWMSKQVITIDQDTSLQEAVSILKKHNIRRLPVLKNGKLVGIVTDRDLKRASASDATSLEIHELLHLLSLIKIGEIMTKNPITVLPEQTIEEAAEILMTHKISGAPVVDDMGQLAGIITQNDLFRVLVSLTGIKRKGIQFACQVADIPGSVKELTDTIRKYGGRIAGILTSYERGEEGPINVYIRAYRLNNDALEKVKQDFKDKALLMYVIDYDRQKREIY
ncbi:MAG: CBS domain-containing protein [Desulfobacterales bacterium]|nr:CBS domain-containing protein [Desulfobacterales bacterium]